MQKIQRYEKAPNILAFITTDKVVIENQITLPEIHQMYRLCGIVYYNNQHFVCRFVDQSGGIWYHDGITTKDQVQYCGNTVNYSAKKLQTSGEYVMSLLIYMRL